MSEGDGQGKGPGAQATTQQPTTLRPALSAVSQAKPTVMAAGGAVAAADSLRGTVMLGEALVPSERMAELRGSERYLPMRELGRGGMGRVDVVFDRVLGRPVAQKSALDQPHARYLVAEAQIGAQLEHPSIVPVYDVHADDGGLPQYTMRVVDGRTLRDVLEDNCDPARPTMPLSQLLGVLRQVCLAVHYAHSRGVVHRDLKPENIIVGAFGEVYVLDWGVACVTDDSDIQQSERLPGSEAVAGSPGYMAPEQALGQLLDARTDVFALGVILHEILTGDPPFEDHDLVSAVKRATRPSTIPPPDPKRLPGALPAAFATLVRSCLRRDPEKRPASARVLADAIDRFLDSERQRREAEQAADERAHEGDAAWKRYLQLDEDALALEKQAEAALGELEPWRSADDKRAAWELGERARRLRYEAATRMAQAETAFARALGHAPNHAAARAGLARLYFHEFVRAERNGDGDRMARQLELARSYDDGALALELADVGELVVETTTPAQLTVARYEDLGMRKVLGEERSLEAGHPILLATGSYLVVVHTDGDAFRCPLLIQRAQRHRLGFRIPSVGEVPSDMLLIPGTRHDRRDMAIARFPVTLREYCRFLDSLDSDQRGERCPGFGSHTSAGEPLIEKRAGGWELSASAVEGAACERVVGRELDIPVHGLCWYDALAYCEWLAESTGLPYRLPTAAEWEKAMRGADGRLFSMGDHLDPSFAKLRQSRPEATQPEPVGAFPLDESPYGVRDMAGGVADWTATFLDGRPAPKLSSQGTEADERQAAYMGGHWGAKGGVRGRMFMAIKHRSTAVGFRLALSLDRHGSSSLEVEPMTR